MQILRIVTLDFWSIVNLCVICSSIGFEVIEFVGKWLFKVRQTYQGHFQINSNLQTYPEINKMINHKDKRLQKTENWDPQRG